MESSVENVYDSGMEKEMQDLWKKRNIYRTKNAYGFVKLQYYTPPTGFENDFTFTDSKELFEDLYEEWLHTQLVALAGEMNVNDIEYDDIYRRLTEEQHRELEEQKKVFAQKAGIVLQ